MLHLCTGILYAEWCHPQRVVPISCVNSSSVSLAVSIDEYLMRWFVRCLLFSSSIPLAADAVSEVQIHPHFVQMMRMALIDGWEVEFYVTFDVSCN